jgi:MSHA pilin protein MshD
MKIRHASRPGFTLVEAVLSLLIVSVVAVAALTAVAQARATRALTSDRSMAVTLARSMIDEVGTRAYADPQSPSSPIGLDAGESAAADRTTLDDVDDYHGISESPPRERSGTIIPDATNWRRDVRVEPVDAAAPTNLSATESGVKRVVVEIYLRGKLVLTQRALRTQAWDTMVAEGGL